MVMTALPVAQRRRAQDRAVEIFTPVVFGLGCFLLWEAAVRLFHIPLYIVPPPSDILSQFVRKFPRIWDYTLVTGSETIVGFLAAIMIGVPLALVVAFSPLLRRTFYPMAVTLEMVPKIVFAPIFVTWFGFGFLPKILVVYLVCFFPILLNGILAFTSLSVEHGRFCLSTGAGPLRTFLKVRLPAALPQLFVGIKGAAVNATVGATIAEWIGGDAGLGYYIQIAAGDLFMDLAFAIIIMLAALGLLLFGLVVLAERLLIPWHVSQREPVQGRSSRMER
jgi:NitT/TauT family transport system permease protein